KTKIIIQTDVDFMFNDIKEQIINSKYEKYTLFDKPIFNIQTKWEIDSIKKKKTIYRLLI
ncbi:hypothetical protein HOK68_05350, partial [Candidatus Woesearchaeota archaeon]|nr:hypothetical protein [Candidatus Woesearchaeota archaeon]